MTSISEGTLTSLAFCWRIERADGAGVALTSHDRAILRDGEVFVPQPGVTPAAITRSLGLEPNSAEVTGALSANALTDSDLALGRWNGAKVQLTAIDWTTPEDAAFTLIAGELGEVSIDGESFAAELTGAASRLAAAACPATSPECRAEFGDRHCRVNLAGRTIRATVESIEANRLVLAIPVEERFLFGRLRFLSGENCGLETVVLGIAGNAVSIRDRPRAAVEPGAVVTLREGCDKRFETCSGRFDNALNFRGEPHLPGNDLLTRYPGA